MTTDLKTIPFAGGQMLATIGPDGRPYVNVRRVCEELGLDADSQAKRLRKSAWATTVEMTVVAGDGKERGMSFISARALPMWMATIQVAKVSPGLQPRLRAYQLEAAEVLARAFMPTAPSAARGVLARLDATAEVMTAAMARLSALSDVAVDHEHRLRALEARPAVSVSLPGRAATARLMRVRYNARLREVIGEKTALMDSREKSEFFAEVNGGLKRAFGDRDGWGAEKFIEASRWLAMNYGIDITDIVVEV